MRGPARLLLAPAGTMALNADEVVDLKHFGEIFPWVNFAAAKGDITFTETTVGFWLAEYMIDKGIDLTKDYALAILTRDDATKKIHLCSFSNVYCMERYTGPPMGECSTAQYVFGIRE